jgi:hypothetical protein
MRLWGTTASVLVQPEILKSPKRTVILPAPACRGSGALRRSLAKQRNLGAESKDPGHACRQMLLGVFRLQATSEDKKSQTLKKASARVAGLPNANNQESRPVFGPFRPKGGIRAHRAHRAHTFPVTGPGKKAGGAISGVRGGDRQTAIPLQSVASSTGETPESRATKRTPYPSLTASGL